MSKDVLFYNVLHMKNIKMTRAINLTEILRTLIIYAISGIVFYIPSDYFSNYGYVTMSLISKEIFYFTFFCFAGNLRNIVS